MLLAAGEKGRRRSCSKAVLELFSRLFQGVGAIEAVSIIFFFGAHFAIWKLYRGQLDDRQRQIDRIAEENREYRDRFMKFIDQEMKFDGAPDNRKRKE